MRTAKGLLAIPAVLLLMPSLFSCSNNDPNTIYLKILNSEDYIADGLVKEFENQFQNFNGKKVEVIYDTFDTMENMFNTLKTGKTKYDLVCASDYMVQKLVNNNLVQKIEHNKVNNYNNDGDDDACYASNYIRDELKSVKWGENDEKVLDDYCECYMWGTLGILYNPTFILNRVSEEKFKSDMESFSNLWDPTYLKTISIKDSMRDTYAIGLIETYKEELKKISDDETLSVEDKKAKRQEIFDRGGESDKEAQKHINEIKNTILNLRKNIFGFEVDSGKEDIIKQTIGIDTAWSGDAVRSIGTAAKAQEEDPTVPNLYYSIPKEGTNLWFDCWTIQTGISDGHRDLAYKFLDFISSPDSVKKNIDAIGYTSAIAGNEVFKYYESIYNAKDKSKSQDYSLDYFFGEGKNLNIENNSVNSRKIRAQFPESSVTDKLMVMKDYGKNNDLILKMWEDVKHESLPVWAIILFSIEIAAIGGLIAFFIIKGVQNKKRRKLRKSRTA